MNKITERSMASFLLIFMWFTILFDPSSLALGTKLVSLPVFILGLAEIFGNLLWLLGFIFFVVAILLIITIFIEDGIKKIINEGINKATKEELRNNGQYSITDKNGKVINKRYQWWNKILLSISTMGSLIGIGSGFWFTGAGWLLLIIAANFYRKIALEITEDRIKEKLEDDNG